MALAVLFATAGMPVSFWDSPSNVMGVILLVVALICIGLALVLARILKTFNAGLGGLLLLGIVVGIYGAWRISG